MEAATQRRPPALPASPQPETAPPAPHSRGCCAAGPRGAAGSRGPCAPRPCPAPARLTMAAARAGPAPPGQRPRDPRPKLRADLAGPPAPACRPECGPAGAGPVARAGPAGPGAGPALRDRRRLPGCPGRAAGGGRRVRWALQPETPGSEGCAEELSTALHWSPGSSLLSPYEWPLQAAHHSGDLSKSPEMFLEGEGFCPMSWEIKH